jgi:hypothetical protein
MSTRVLCRFTAVVAETDVLEGLEGLEVGGWGLFSLSPETSDGTCVFSSFTGEIGAMVALLRVK